MKPPPDHVAATVEVPVKRSRTAITLVPGASTLPLVAYQEIMVWVTSSGWKLPPLIPQSVRGAFASETSARTGVVAPWSCSTASCAVAALTQLAWSAAHAGTTTGLGSGVGEADALGVGLGLGDGVGVEVGAGVVRFAAGLEGKRTVRRARGDRSQAKEENYPVPHGTLKRTKVWMRYARPLVVQVAQNTAWPFSAGLRIDDDEGGWARGGNAGFRHVLEPLAHDSHRGRRRDS